MSLLQGKLINLITKAELIYYIGILFQHLFYHHNTTDVMLKVQFLRHCKMNESL